MSGPPSTSAAGTPGLPAHDRHGRGPAHGAGPRPGGQAHPPGVPGAAAGRRGGRRRRAPGSQPGPLRLAALALHAGRLRLLRPAVGGPQAGRRAGHAALRGGRHQRAVHRPARRGQDDAGRRPRACRGGGGDAHLLRHRRRAGRPLPPGRPQGRWATTMRFYAGPRLLIIDEVGYLPLPAEAAAALFQVVTQRYLKGSIALTTNLGIASWGKVFNDDPMVAAAMLDRLLHRSVVLDIKGDSYRMRSHRARAEAARRAVNGS